MNQEKDSVEKYLDKAVTQPIVDLMIDIACENSDFVCCKCLDTLEVLGKVLAAIDGKVAKETMKEVKGILEGE